MPIVEGDRVVPRVASGHPASTALAWSGARGPELGAGVPAPQPGAEHDHRDWSQSRL